MKFENEIICGDCLEVMKDWPDGCVDLVLTDPPYGINIGKSQRLCKERGLTAEWDKKPIENDDLLSAVSKGKNAIVWGGNYYSLPPTRGYLIWDKLNAGRDFADCEMAWTSFDAVARRFQFRPMNMDGGKIHPTQKPISLMKWCILYADQKNDNGLILDPFCGSGTTCLAAKMLGRRYIGIDISEDYCQIARDRLRAVDTGVPVKEARASQGALFE